MAALLFPTLLETLDYTVVATAQPRLASVFNALNLQSYIGTSYLLSSTVFLPFFASVADIYGRYFGFQVSLLLFLIGSAVSTGAVNMAMVLAGRGIAGIGAAGLLTIVRTVLSDTRSLDTNSIRQSCLFLLYSIGITVGPVIGGSLATANFRWVFGINLPFTALAIFFCYLFLPKNTRGAQKSDVLPTHDGRVETWLSKLVLIDWVGTFLFCIGGILMLLALNWGSSDNWKSTRVIAGIILGAFSLVLCMAWEVILERKRLSPACMTGIYRAHPMIPIVMFSSFDTCVIQYGAFVSGIFLFVMFYFVSIFATIVTGLSATQAGIQLLYFSLGLGLGTLVAIRMVAILRQPIYPIVLGFVMMTVSLGLASMAIQKNSQGEVNGFLVMIGFGIALTASPSAVHARFMKPDHVAITNAMLLFFRTLGGTVGLTQCFTIMNARADSYINSQISSGAAPKSDLAVLAAVFHRDGLTTITALDGLPSGVQSIIRDAFRDALYWSFISLLPWAALATILSMFLSNIPDTDSARDSTLQGDDGEIERKTEETEAKSVTSETH
ncbi:MFS general substrate transporter [Paxillus ammoniavirescens]|nr:MFS general substrate transporter [Paxillus ammoniavirescens]